MACCEKHDRMDLVLGVQSYLDSPCGTPTNPDGEQRYCCRKCPSVGKPLNLQARWASNPTLMRQLTIEEQTEVLRKAVEAGPLFVDIRTALPAPVANAVTNP